MASRRNATPLPLIEGKDILKLPTLNHSLLGASYKVTAQKRRVSIPPPASGLFHKANVIDK